MSHTIPTLFFIYNELKNDKDLRKMTWSVKQITSYFVECLGFQPTFHCKQCVSMSSVPSNYMVTPPQRTLKLTTVVYMTSYETRFSVYSKT